MEVDFKFQIAGICFYLVILTQYILNRKIKTHTNQIFRLLMIVSGINLIFDVITVCTLVYFDSISILLVRGAHQVFIFTIDLFAALLFLFVVSLTKESLHLKMKWFLLALFPLIASAVVVLFGPLEYHHENGVFYSYGMSANTVYVSVAIYLILDVIFLAQKQTSVEKSTRNVIYAAVFSEVLTAVIQLLRPTMLMSSLGQVLILMVLYNTLINPKEFTEKESGVLNRYAFQRMTDEMFLKKKSFYVITICIDNWNVINTSFDTNFSYQIIRNMEKELRHLTHQTVYRNRTTCLSLLYDGSPEEGKKLLDIVIGRLKENWRIDNTEIAINTRLLVMECPKFASNMNEAFRIVELFMNQIYTWDESQTEYFMYGDAQKKQTERHMAVEQILKDAIENDGIYVVYQPIYSVEDGYCSSAEALVRLWDNQTIGYIPPDEFVKIAERYGMIHDLGRVVFEHVCRFIHENDLEQLRLRYIEVNLSGLQCMDNQLADELIQMMEKYQVSPERINFEITESAAVEAGKTVMENINRLVDAGSSFSMDDYGTGYSNLAMMTDMPYKIIKIDKSLIWPCFKGNERIRTILESTVSMVHNLGIHIVAEGVETEEMQVLLKQLGVGHMQGYLFAKPLPSEEFMSYLLREKKSKKATE